MGVSMDTGRAGIAALVLLFLLSAGLQDRPGEGRPADPGDFNGCYTGAWCYWQHLPPVLLYGIEVPDPYDEMYGIDALNATERRIETAETVEVVIECEDEKRRVIARVYVDGENLSRWLMRNGYAKPDRDRTCRGR